MKNIVIVVIAGIVLAGSIVIAEDSPRRGNPDAKFHRSGAAAERPRSQFSEETRRLAAVCRREPTEENRAALKKQIGIDLDRCLEEQRATFRKGNGTRKGQGARRPDAMKRDRDKRIEAIMARMLDPQGGRGNRDRRGRD